MAAKRILLGITGGIAAYKSAELVRLLKKAGLEVRVVMTRGAEAFITPLTFQALSGEPVRTSLLDPEAEAGMGHIELAKWPTRWWLRRRLPISWPGWPRVWQTTC